MVHLQMWEMQETWDQHLGREDSLEEEMATHSSIFAWESPWTEEPGELQEAGSQVPRALKARLKVFPHGSVVKNLPAKAGDTGDVGLIPGLGRSPGGGNGNPLQYSCLENSMNRGARWATVHRGSNKLDTTEQPIHKQISKISSNL